MSKEMAKDLLWGAALWALIVSVFLVAPLQPAIS
jgi:hypothetical protein